MTIPPEHKNGTVQALTALASSGDNWIKLITIVLIAISGGGNFIKTSSVNDMTQINHAEIHRALEQIQRIDSIVDDAITRQKQINDSIKDVLKELKQQQQQKQNP